MNKQEALRGKAETLMGGLDRVLQLLTLHSTDTFIHIHDFLIAQSCKKTAAALVKEAPEGYGLAARKNSKGSSKLLDLVQACANTISFHDQKD
jgi:hypothetical protein